LAERFSDILVDEFQDTNLLQVELIKRLRGPDTRLFTVGDEFQSIYGFRHADVEVFRAERERGRRLALRGNFRSAPGVLAAVNAIGRALLNGFEPLTVGALPPTPAEGAATIGPAVEVIAVQADGWDEEEVGLTGDEQVDAAPQRIAEARVLAHRLAELASSGVPRGEMVVLLRAFGDVSAYEEALERAGLRPAVAGGRGYWSQQQVEDMRCLLGVLANPLDDQRLLGALASPACGASPDALWILRRLAGRRRHIWPELSRRFGPGDDRAAPVPGGESDRSEGEDAAGPLGASGAESDREVDAHAEADEPLEEAERLIAAIPPEEAERLIAATPAEDADRLRGFCARVAALRPDAGLLPLDSLVERAARDFGYDLAVLMAPRGRRRWANVRKLMTLAREHEEREGRDLAGFLEVLEARAERDEREPEAAVETEGHDGVRIMTVHNAKGLEFGTVAVADLGRRLGAGGFAPALRLRREGGADGPMRIGLRLARAARDSLRLFDLDALHREARDDEAAEELRLIHVAVSRAQRRLILAGTLDPAALARAADGAPKPSDPPLLRILRALGLGARDGVPALESADGELSPIGAGANVRVPAPEAREGLEASFAGGEIAISFHRPGPSAGAELATVRHEAEERPRGPSGEPPGPPVAARERPPPPPSAGHLSHAALDLYARCGYRFYVERVAGLRAAPPPQADPEAEREEGEPDEPGSSERMALGTAVHGLLEWSARHRWLRPGEPTVLAHLRRGGLEGTGPERRRAQGLLDAWLESALCSELRTGRARTLPEAPFLLPVAGTLVRGKLDLLVERPGEPPLLVDYKTNALGGTSPAKLMALYAAQRDLYALAVASAAASGSASRVESGGGGDGDGPTLAPVSTAFVFLEQGGEPALATLGPEALATVRSRIEGLATGIAAARFEVTERPHRGLCHDCPARERLCSHPDELTMKPCHPLP
jgi:ATP-dependent exoDNAse (exonuclease V) beta subunit